MAIMRTSIEGLRAFQPLLQILLFGIHRRSRMNQCGRTTLGRGDQLCERAGLDVLDEGQLVGIVCEQAVVEIRALVACRAAGGFDVRFDS
jgi:hypothetical protein